MTTGNTAADTARAAADITAAYAGNPTPTLTPDQVIKLFQDLHGAVAGASGVVVAEPAAQITQQRGKGAGKADLVAIAPPAKTESEPAAPASSSTQSMQSLIAASSVNAGLSGNLDPAAVWPNSTEEQRSKFIALINKFHIPLDANGVPRPRLPPEELVQGWEVRDPIDGKGFQMLKRRLRSAYDLDIVELRAMFHLGEDFPVTAPLYSESKRRQANSSGLGKGPKGKKKEAAAAEATPITAKTSKSTKAKTPAKKTTRATARAA